MNVPDNRTRLVESLKNLEEEEALEILQVRIQAKDDVEEILEDVQAGMTEVGKLYEEGTYFISGLMLAGEIFRGMMEILEPFFDNQHNGKNSGHVLLGTVQGDIHNLGKDMVKTLLLSQGFKVTDLGVDVSPALFAGEALKSRPDILALSGLLTGSYNVMGETIKEIRKVRDYSISAIPVIVGGGMMTANVAVAVGADYWATDALVGVQLCQQIMKEKSR